MRRFLARLGTLSVLVTGLGVTLGVPGAVPAMAAPGFDLDITELPGTFRAGAGAQRVSAVVSTTNNDGCRKVLWSMVVRVQGLRLDQVRVDRIEQNGSFPVRVSTDGNTARITDNQLDPGTLCRGRTVTAQYRVAIAADVSDGRIIFTPEAYDRDQRLLARASASREIRSDRSRPDRADRAERKPATTPPSQTEPPADESSDDESADDEPAEGSAPQAGEQPGSGAGRADATAATRGGGTGLVTVGFVVGGLMLFLGVGLLLRLRRRMLGDDGAGDLAMAGDQAMADPFGRARARTVRRGGSRSGRNGPRRRPSTTRY